MLITKDKEVFSNVNDFDTVQKDGISYTGESAYLVDDTDDIAEKVCSYFPDFDFVEEEGKLVDIVSVPHVATEEELNNRYEALTVEKIRQRYTQTDENKVLREALASGDYTAFDVYNAYVEQCKAEARLEVYGNDEISV